jgi:hypothetical protein
MSTSRLARAVVLVAGLACGTALAVALGTDAGDGRVLGASTADTPLPPRLSQTGLFDAGTTAVRASHLSFSPQYPLWSDGAAKRRWIHVPEGTAIDAAQMDAWDFPPGTRLWKEFAYDGPVETRFLERLADGSWRFATYVWDADGRDAMLVPEEGAVVARNDAPGGRYVLPSRDDCLACHEGASVPVLGFSALQLSPDRDPLAPHAEPRRADDVDLSQLAATGRLRNLPPATLARPPRIAARSPVERGALGYLHANCGHCHNDEGPLASLDLPLAQPVGVADHPARTLAALVGHDSRFRPHGSAGAQRVAMHGDATSVVVLRMRTGNRLARMPPLGTQVVDDEALALVERWIRQDVQRHQGEAR